MFSKKHFAVAVIVLVMSSAMQLVQADRLFLTQPTDSSEIYLGCPVDLGFRVRYSDMAMLQWVQLQVLTPNNDVLVESVDRSTREDWNDKRSKNVSWTVPSDWAPGDYTVRAFGNATYPCSDPATGHRTRCGLILEDRGTMHIQPLAVNEACPGFVAPSSPSTTIDNDTEKDEEDKTSSGVNVSLDSSSSYTQQNKDALYKNLADNNNTIAPTVNQTLGQAYNFTSSSEINSNNETEGYSAQLRIVLDQATVQRMQEQQILKILNEAQDYSLVNSTVTMEDGSVKQMSELMDNSTIARFLQTLEQTNSTVITTMNATSLEESSNPVKLLQIIHGNSSLITIAPPVNTTHSVMLNHNDTMSDGSAGSPGHGLAQQPDKDQIQDKTKESGASAGARVLTGIVLLATTLSTWVLQ